ncbi:5-oxoprolinase subunit PxpB [Metabacillus herbersteinensis]|uniref:5-oxoprolinase subunit PxpB n=1 Tax=Metabacillus herbersteinensis TaxID=283816 RepID=A0ABV6GHY7_9BACI
MKRTSSTQRIPEMKPLGDSALIIVLGTEINPSTHLKVKIVADYLEQHPFPGFIECVPAFTSVTVFYHPAVIYHSYNKDRSPYQVVCSLICESIKELEGGPADKKRTVDVPVCYGGELGPDLEVVAQLNNLTTDEVIEIHTKGEYLVYMIGFAPGFPYLGGMSERIAAPRHRSPRVAIPAGSVGIAGMQTGVYPISTPGGWQLIGRTPLELFRPSENPPTLLQSGDLVKFSPISLKEYEVYKEKKGNKL